jgi:hypothetical protein
METGLKKDWLAVFITAFELLKMMKLLYIQIGAKI